MKSKYLLAFLTLATCNAYAQILLNPDFNLKLKYDSATTQFESYERLHGGFIQTQNIKMHYLHWGNPKDTPIIWIHGSFTNAYELAGIAEEIVRRGYYLIAIDYYGHGLTKIPKHEVSLFHVADDIKALMDEQSRENWHAEDVPFPEQYWQSHYPKTRKSYKERINAQ